jgi:hypothetical protein
LSPVLVGQLLDRLDFEDDFTVAHKVRLILLLQRSPFVLESKSRLFLEWNLLLVQLLSRNRSAPNNRRTEFQSNRRQI